MRCNWCGCDQETDKHIFFDCILAQEVWSSIGMLKAICMPAASNFKDWFDCFLKFQGKEIAELIVVTMWMIWKSRNQSLFAGKDGDAT